MPAGARVIRDAVAADAGRLAAIYNHYVTTSIVTFEEQPVATGDYATRVHDVQAAGLPWLVAAHGDVITGFAYATRWRARSGYRHSAEVTVYVAPAAAGRGIGGGLYGELFLRLQALAVHAVMGGIALPNDASVALHEKFGMRKVAHFHEVGFKFGRWIDVGYWQRTL